MYVLFIVPTCFFKLAQNCTEITDAICGLKCCRQVSYLDQHPLRLKQYCVLYSFFGKQLKPKYGKRSDKST